jgi:predicted Zn-dependent peptidase
MRRPVRDGREPAVPAVGASVWGAAADGPDARPLAKDGNASTEALESGVFRTVLPSGAIVLSERMESVRSVALGTWFRAGTAHEPAGLGGAAHLLEHMVFKGTERRSAREIALEIERLGGGLDAYTSHEHTSFQARVPDTALETAVDVLADLGFSARLAPTDLELEREVVLEEIARVDDTPDDLVFDLHAEFLFPGHPYGAPILGTRESVEAVSAEALGSLRDAAYRPAGLVVAAAGRIEHDRLVDLVAARLPPEPGDPPGEVPAPAKRGTGLRRIERPGGRQVHLVAGAPGVPWGDPLRDASVIVNTALGGGMSSRLFQRIREDLGLAYSVFSWQSFYRSGGATGAYLGTRPESAGRARDALLAEFARIAREGLPPDEDVATRTQLKGQLLLSLESPGSRMHRLAGTVLHDEPYRPLDEIARRIDGVTPEQIREVCAGLEPDGLAVLELAPA